MRTIISILFLLAALALGAGLVTLVIGIGPLWLKGATFGGAAVLGALGWGGARAVRPSPEEKVSG